MIALRTPRVAAWLALGALLAAGCPSAPLPDVPAPVVQVAHAQPEGTAPVVTLTKEAVANLGIETTQVVAHTTARTRAVAGVVTVPPGRAIAVAAPLAGTVHAGKTVLVAGTFVQRGQELLRLVPLAPVDRDLRVQARRQQASTHARLEMAQARLDRMQKLLGDRAASARAVEEATADLETARAEDDAAIARRRGLDRAPLDADVTLPVVAPVDGVVRTIGVATGQSVSAGVPLFELMPAGALWVRVPVPNAGLNDIDVDAPARITRLGASIETGIAAMPVVAPPSADPLAATIDLFYALGPETAFARPGERVMATLPYRARTDVTAVPASAVFFDTTGRTWVYACADDTVFTRRPVEVIARESGLALLGQGPAVGTCVVAVGAAELVGAEYGVGH